MAGKENGHSTLNGNANGIEAEEVDIPVPWGIVKGKWWGPKDKQPILATHGWQDNAGTWDNFAPLLPADISMLCIDLPGHGWSSHYPAGFQYYLFWDGISILRRVVKYYKWKKVTLLGHSLGGALSFMYAATFPDEVDRFISIDIASPAIKDPAKIADAIPDSINKFLKYEELTEENIPSYEYEDMVNIMYKAYLGSVTKENCKILLKRCIETKVSEDGKKAYYFNRDVRLKIAALAMITIDQAMEYAKRIKCKVLNIRAVPGMKWDHPEYYNQVLEQMRETAEFVEYHEIDGTHHIQLNNPERIIGPILQFLEKI